MNFIVRGVPQEVADEVRHTKRSPGYGHPAHLELATGTGPCRCCLRPFVPGVDERLLFTFRPAHAGALSAPGPVFIHPEHCDAWSGDGFPDALRVLPLAFEARAHGSRILGLTERPVGSAEAAAGQWFEADAEWLHLRHADAGCYIATVERG